MELNYFTNLPTEITTEILSRLSIRNLAISKSVCKAWHDLFDFVKSKIKTPPALVLFYWGDNSTRCTIFEIEDEDEDDLESHNLHYHPLTDLEIPHGNTRPMVGITANALLLLYSLSMKGVYICNLITREYTELNYPDDCIPYQLLQFGFGVSKISGQYKVVCVHVDIDSRYVYTLGTGTWRRVEAGATSGHRIYSAGHIVCNGNIHWIGVYYSAYTLRICAFDLENECFSVFSPPLPVEGRSHLTGELSALRDSLCYSYAWEDEIVIWLMKEYHVEESWTILYKISNNGFDFDRASGIGWNYMCVKLIKLFKDGDILMLLDKKRLIYYSNKTRTIQQVGMFNDATAKDYVSALIFTPSLFSLKNFGFENVISF